MQNEISSTFREVEIEERHANWEQRVACMRPLVARDRDSTPATVKHAAHIAVPHFCSGSHSVALFVAQSLP